jgi:hypothetical protein
LDCPVGKFTSSAGSSSCATCPAGNYINGSSCNKCTPGYYSITAQSKCDFCSPGKYSSLPGSTTCSNCVGGISPSNASSSCQVCTAGFYSPAGLLCLPCPISLYANTSGLTICHTCDPMTNTQLEGSTSKSACLCQAGYYGDVSVEQCRPCSQGPAFICPFGSRIPWISTGYYRAGPTGEAANIVFTCSPTTACVRTEYDTTTTCGQGYTGFLCGECSNLYYKYSGTCKKCPGNLEKGLSIFAATLVLVLLIWRLSDQKTQIPTDVRVTIQALQMLALFPNISSKWPPFLNNLFQVFSILVSCYLKNIRIFTFSLQECKH